MATLILFSYGSVSVQRVLLLLKQMEANRTRYFSSEFRRSYLQECKESERPASGYFWNIFKSPGIQMDCFSLCLRRMFWFTGTP